MNTLQYLSAGLQISAWYVTGMTDGDGSFGINKSNNQVSHAEFKVTAHALNRGMLLALKAYFGCGRISIDNRKDNTLKYVVTSITDLTQKIITLP